MASVQTKTRFSTIHVTGYDVIRICDVIILT